jgi:hypothetical protein
MLASNTAGLTPWVDNMWAGGPDVFLLWQGRECRGRFESLEAATAEHAESDAAQARA